MPNELKPCPFCGEKPDTEIIYLSSAFPSLGEFDPREPIVNVGCSHCGIAISYRPDFWNTRPAEDAKDKEIERLKTALEQIASLRNLNPEMKANKFSSCAEDDLRNFYCTMGDIAKTALFNAPDTGKMEEN